MTKEATPPRTGRWTDRVIVRLMAFAIALAAAFGVGAGFGATIGPAGTTSDSPGHESTPGE